MLFVSDYTAKTGEEEEENLVQVSTTSHHINTQFPSALYQLFPVYVRVLVAIAASKGVSIGQSRADMERVWERSIANK